MIRLALFFLILDFGVHAQAVPFQAEFERLMGEPKDVVNDLVNFPWKTEVPDSISGFQRVAPKDTIRIVSVDQPLEDHASWKRWESEDGVAWVDLVTLHQPSMAAEIMQSARQRYSGYRWANQMLFFTNLGDKSRDSVGAMLIAPDGSLLNLGMRLPLDVRYDRPLPEGDRVAFDAALTRFQSILDLVARSFLDPTYVTLGPAIAPKAETLPILRMAGFARLWSYIKYNFVYLDQRPEAKWDSRLEEYLPRIAAAKDDIEYGRILQQAVALLKDGHTNVYPNAVAPQDSPLIVLEPIEGKPVATSVGTLSELSAIQPGMELLEIDGRPVSAIIEQDLDPYISSSTPQDRQLRRMRMLLQGPPNSVMRTKWITPDGKTVETRAWIVDLRLNGGGSSDIGYRILAHFLKEPVEGSTWRTRQYNPTFQAWGKPQVWYEGDPDKIQPAAEPRYAGPIFVLTSPNTCSAAEDFLIPLKMAKRITIVGEPTCGSSGQPLQFSIYGAAARVCTKWDEFPDGTEFVGVGVLPDVTAARNKEDVNSRRDAVLQKALELARQ